MRHNSLDLKKKFSTNGYFVLKNFFSQKYILKIINEINNSDNTIKYFDNENKLRRIEKLFDKGTTLKDLNNKIIKFLNKFFDNDFIIFKDKFNAKPAGGEGFFAHYDGVFYFIDPDNNLRKGWYEYGDYFVNVLIALDNCNKDNGSIELAKAHAGTFEDLIKNTKNDGTPALNKKVESNIKFNLINLKKGDIVIFLNTCPHRSKKNNTNEDRKILYYTYSLSKNGSKYDAYFEDKKKSRNPSKALADN